nr:216_t:CDS:2 [Entrophospora candida]
MLFLPDYIPKYVQYFISISSVLVIGASTLLYAFQCELIYLARFPEGSRQYVAKPSEKDIDYEDVTITTKDNVRIKLYVCKLRSDADKRPTVLIFHANAGNMGHRLPIAERFYKLLKCNVVMLSYRGYGLSEGKPHEKGIRIDSQALLDYVLNDEVLKNTKLIAYGQSLGGAVSIDLVSRNEDKFSGMILENTFLSIPKLIPHVLPYLKYFTFLCHQIWNSEQAITQIVNTPILFLSGKLDELVPSIHMKKLYEINLTSRSVKQLNSNNISYKEFSHGTHNDTCIQPYYFDCILEFIKVQILNEH